MASKLKLTELLYPTSTTPAITINADDTVTFGAATTTITNLSTTNLAYTGTLTGGTGAVNIGSGQVYKDASGNVGIGTTSPQAKLAVSNGGAAGLEFFVNYPGGGVGTYIQSYNRSSPGYVNTAYDAADHSFRISGTEKMFLNSSGNLGIGTGSPNQRLQVTGSNSTGFAGATLQNSNGNVGLAGVQFSSDTTYSKSAIAQVRESPNGVGPLVFYVDSNTDAADWSAGDEKMRITAGGNLVLGATTDIGGERVSIKASTSNGTSWAFYVRNSSETAIFAVLSNGAIYTGTAASSPYNNTTGSAANMFVGADGALYRSTSSLKYKKQVNDATHGLSDVMNLRPVTYKGKSESDGDKVFGGLIAEEVHEAGLTEFVQYAEDGSPDALAYGNMVSLCIKAIQEQQALIQDLTTRLNTLEGN